MTMKNIIQRMENIKKAAQHVIDESVVMDSITSVEPSAVNVGENVEGIFFVDEKKTENVKHLLQKSVSPFTEQIYANALESSRNSLLEALMLFRKVDKETRFALYEHIKELAEIVNPELVFELKDRPEDADELDD